MSLEDNIAKLTAAVEKQNGLLEKMMAGAKTTAPAADKTPAAGAKTPAAGAKAPAAGAKAGTKPTAPKTPSLAVISTRFGDYMKAGDEDAREAAKINVRALVAHYGAPKLTEIDAAHFPKLIEYLDKWEAGEEVEFDALDDDGDEDGGDGESLL